MLALPDFPVRQRDFLLEISRAITEQLDLSEVLRRVLQASTVMLAGRVAFIALRNESDDSFAIRAILGVPSDRVPELNEKLGEMISSVQEGFDYEAINAKLEEIAATIDQELRQFVAMPLIFAEEPLGLLIVFRSYQSQAMADDLKILQSFANQAAIAVHNAQLYEHINQERQRLAATIQYSGDGIMILDAALAIQNINRAFEYISGWNIRDAIGRHHDDVIVWQRLQTHDLHRAVDGREWAFQNEHGDQSVRAVYVEGDLLRRDGLTISLGITYAPVFNAEGALISIVANVRDITNFRKAQEMQNTFISTISHELKTPVALIKGYASTLRRDDADWDRDTLKGSLAVIEEEADRLTALINDLLVASKIQAEQKLSLNITDARLDELAMRSVERFSAQSDRHNFEFSFPADFPSVPGDETRLRQVIDNLLTNALKYSPQGGTITVGGRYTEEDVTIFVRDEGVGISERDQEHIFDRFFRVDDHLSRKTQGAGLGLYLVKAIVEAHNGRIWVKSQPGSGSTFYFTIPRNDFRVTY